MPENTEHKTKNFVLRIDTKMMSAIEQWASDDFRSVNGQILFLLDDALRRGGRKAK